MRISLLVCALVLVCASHAQTYVPGSFGDYRFGRGMYNRNDNVLNKKWSLNKYSGISTSFIGWKGGYATVLSAPVGMQLNRRINNNVFAFAGLSVAPAYINFHQTFMTADINKSPYSSILANANSFNLYPRAEVGLSYINDERTFQISGRISVERNSNRMPMFLPNNNTTTSKYPL